MNPPKFPHSAMFVGVTACGKTEFLLRLVETVYKDHFEFIVILCPTILDNKTYLSRKWIFDDKNVFIIIYFFYYLFFFYFLLLFIFLSIFYISMDLSTNYLLILVGVELPLCVVVTLS